LDALRSGVPTQDITIGIEKKNGVILNLAHHSDKLPLLE
jgi:hypothetical protein